MNKYTLLEEKERPKTTEIKTETDVANAVINAKMGRYQLLSKRNLRTLVDIRRDNERYIKQIRQHCQ